MLKKSCWESKAREREGERALLVTPGKVISPKYPSNLATPTVLQLHWNRRVYNRKKINKAYKGKNASKVTVKHE